MTTALRMSRDMFPEVTMDLAVATTPERARPLGYLYSDVDPSTIDGSTGSVKTGHYDPESQTWVGGSDFITAGVPTKTMVITRPNMHEQWPDYPTDDACQ